MPPPRQSKQKPPAAASSSGGTKDDRAPRRAEGGTKSLHVCCRVFLVTIGTLLVIFTTILAGICGLWKTNNGRDYLIRRALQIRGDLVIVPQNERGFSWRVKSLASLVLYDLPGFIVGFHGDRAFMYETVEFISHGGQAGFKDSFMTFSYDNVSNILTNPNQPRGQYLGNAKVPSRCMGSDTLIFLGTGETHTEIRNILIDAVEGFRNPLYQNSDKSSSAIELDFGTDDVTSDKYLSLDNNAKDEILKRTLVRTLFKTVFGAPISPDGFAALMEYPAVGGTCVLGEDFHTITGGIILSKLDAIRRRIRLAIAETPVGKDIKERAKKAVAEGRLPGNTEEEKSGDALLRQLADGVAFAGTLGTTHLSTHALARIRSDPKNYVPLFMKNPINFLHEEARVDPPVTSVTSVLHEDKVVNIANTGSASFAKGTPFQTVISTANVDPNIFGGNHHSRDLARMFHPDRDNLDEMLSWNGRLGDVKDFKAPRGCPGYRLSMAIANALVDKFKPAANAVPTPLDAESTAARAELPNIHPILKYGNDRKSKKNILDITGFLVWMFMPMICVGFIIGKTPGTCTSRYIMYLLSQSVVAASYLFENSFIFLLSQATAAVAYMLIFIVVHFQDKPNLGAFYSIMVWSIYFFIITAISWFYYKGHGEEPIIESLQGIVYIFYSVGASLGVLSIIKFYRLTSTEYRDDPSNPDKKNAAWLGQLGMIGAFFGVFDLLEVYIPYFGHFISRLSDSFLYVPPVILAMQEMDRRYPKSNFVLPNRGIMKRILLIISVLVVLVSIAFARLWSTVASGDVCAFDKPYPSSDTPHYKLCKHSPIADVDAYGRVMFSVIRFVTGDQNPVDSLPESILIPRYERPLGKIEVIRDSKFTIPIDDEDSPEEHWMTKEIREFIVNKVLKSSLLFPIHDDAATWNNIEEAKLVLKIAGGPNIPPPVGDWEDVDVTSDDAITQMVFAGLAGARLEKIIGADIDDAVWKADFSELVTLDVRPGYENFGATAYFNSDLKLVRIFWAFKAINVYPKNSHWGHAKWVFRCSALLGITAIEHLLENHLIYANIGSTAAREALPKDHPMRRFMKPFNHKTPSINLGAFQFLTTENSLLHRATALTFEGMTNGFKYALAHVRYTPNPLEKHKEDLKVLGDRFPYAKDGLDFYEIIYNFVKNYIEIYYPTDIKLLEDAALEKMFAKVKILPNSGLPAWKDMNRVQLIEVVTGYIFHVTGFHHVVGNVAEYLMHPQFASPRIKPNSEISGVEASHYGILVAILTGLKAPKLLNNFDHLLLQDDHFNETSKAFEDFRARLSEFSVEVRNRNKLRQEKGRSNGYYQFWGFDPERLLCSVSI